MTTDQEHSRADELYRLREGLARLAQKAGLGHYIPGCVADSPYEVIARAAREHDRGWHALIARLMDCYEENESPHPGRWRSGRPPSFDECRRQIEKANRLDTKK